LDVEKLDIQINNVFTFKTPRIESLEIKNNIIEKNINKSIEFSKNYSYKGISSASTNENSDKIQKKQPLINIEKNK